MYQWCSESAYGSVPVCFIVFGPPGSAYPDPHLDTYQNITNPQHWQYLLVGK
jgi:hypothetical protein